MCCFLNCWIYSRLEAVIIYFWEAIWLMRNLWDLRCFIWRTIARRFYLWTFRLDTLFARLTPFFSNRWNRLFLRQQTGRFRIIVLIIIISIFLWSYRTLTILFRNSNLSLLFFFEYSVAIKNIDHSLKILILFIITPFLIHHRRTW